MRHGIDEGRTKVCRLNGVEIIGIPKMCIFSLPNARKNRVLRWFRHIERMNRERSNIRGDTLNVVRPSD